MSFNRTRCGSRRSVGFLALPLFIFAASVLWAQGIAKARGKSRSSGHGFGDAAFRRAYLVSGHASFTLWREEPGSGRWALEYADDRSHLSAAT